MPKLADVYAWLAGSVLEHIERLEDQRAERRYRQSSHKPHAQLTTAHPPRSSPSAASVVNVRSAKKRRTAPRLAQ